MASFLTDSLPVVEVITDEVEEVIRAGEYRSYRVIYYNDDVITGREPHSSANNHMLYPKKLNLTFLVHKIPINFHSTKLKCSCSLNVVL